MHRKTLHIAAAALALAIFLSQAPARAADEVNIYSARHYDSDTLLCDGFRKAISV